MTVRADTGSSRELSWFAIGIAIILLLTGLATLWAAFDLPGTSRWAPNSVTLLSAASMISIGFGGMILMRVIFVRWRSIAWVPLLILMAGLGLLSFWLGTLHSAG